jgi:hypothetical protein
VSQQENLIQSLQNSFTQRRQRKGSLPELHVNHTDLNDTTLIFSEITNSQPKFNEPSVISHSGCECSQSVHSKTGSLAACKRFSRRSAFVLDPMRTSMFRSKSLTDLNHSIVKGEKSRGSVRNLAAETGDNQQASVNNLALNNNSIIENGNSTLNLSRVSDPMGELQRLEN